MQEFSINDQQNYIHTKTVGEKSSEDNNLYEFVPGVITNQCNSFQSMIKRTIFTDDNKLQ